MNPDSKKAAAAEALAATTLATKAVALAAEAAALAALTAAAEAAAVAADVAVRAAEAEAEAAAQTNDADWRFFPAWDRTNDAALAARAAADRVRRAADRRTANRVRRALAPSSVIALFDGLVRSSPQTAARADRAADAADEAADKLYGELLARRADK